MGGNGHDGVNRRAPETAGTAAPAAATDHSAQPVSAPTRGSSSSSNAVAPIPTPSNQNQGDIQAPAAAAVSGPGPGPGPGPVRRQKKRAQVSKACQRCRRLQKGCSESRPCQRCIGVGLEDQCLRSEMVNECHRSGSRHGQQQHHSQSQAQALAPRSYVHPGLVPASATASAGVIATTTWSFIQLPASPESLVNYLLAGGGAGVASASGSATSLHQAQQQYHQPSINPLPKPVLDHCIPRFFSRLYPTIPILTPSYVDHLLHVSSSSSDNGSAEAQTLLTSLSALVLLQIEHPSHFLFTSIGIPHSNSVYGRLLFEEAQASHHRTLALGTHAQKRFAPTLERVLITFFLYACHAVLFHHSQAFFWLREASTLWVVLRVGDDGSDTDGPEGEGGVADMRKVRKTLADRLFWVLLVSERSHGIRYRRPITLQITPTTPSLDCTDPEFVGLASLVALFRPLDTGFMALLNQEVTSAFGSPAMVAGPLDVVEKSIAEAVPDPSPGLGPGAWMGPGPGSGPVSLPSMSPDGRLVDSTSVSPTTTTTTTIQPPPLLPTGHLHTTQIANLKITQLWLRVILWQIRLRIGLLIPPPPPPPPPPPAPVASRAPIKESLTYHHPLSIARSLVQVTKSLPLESIRVHGVGLTEKVFDIACAMVDVLAKVPLEDRRKSSASGSVGSLLTMRERQEERERHLQEEEKRGDLEWIRGLIHRLPGGEAIYDELLGKHIAGVLPGLGLRAFED